MKTNTEKAVDAVFAVLDNAKRDYSSADTMVHELKLRSELLRTALAAVIEPLESGAARSGE